MFGVPKVGNGRGCCFDSRQKTVGGFLWDLLLTVEIHFPGESAGKNGFFERNVKTQGPG